MPTGNAMTLLDRDQNFRRRTGRRHGPMFRRSAFGLQPSETDTATASLVGRRGTLFPGAVTLAFGVEAHLRSLGMAELHC